MDSMSMSQEELELVDRFYDNDENFIYSPDGELMWTDFKEAKEYIDNHPEVFCYTSIEGDYDTIWLLPGYRYVNRLGYLITKIDMQISEDGIREL
jgi:hypothetical protein